MVVLTCMDNLDNCHADCCRWMQFGKHELTSDQVDYYTAHGCKVTKMYDNLFMILVPCECKNLVDSKCVLHDNGTKPEVCKRFGEVSTKGCYVVKGCLYE